MYVLSADVGTTNLKLNVYHESLELLGSSTYSLKQVNKDALIYELSMEEIWQALVTLVQEAITEHQITSFELVLTTAMHSIQLLHPDMSLAGPLITWNDQRGATYLQESSPEQQTAQYLATGVPNHVMNPFYKLQAFDLSGYRIGSIKDVLFYRLTGEWCLDVSSASATGLYAIQQGRWHESSLAYLNLQAGQLPSIALPTYRETLSPGLFPAQGQVYLGTTDGVAANQVFHAFPDTAVLSIGTSHAVRIIDDAPRLHSDTQNFAYQIDKTTFLMGLPSNNGSNVIEWLREVFQADYGEINQILDRRPMSEALFLPFLNGERSPLWDAQARASYHGLHRGLGREELIFSGILGMLLNIRDNVEELAKLSEFRAIGLLGGVTKLPAFAQLLADVLGRDILIPELENAETLGGIHLATGRPIQFTSKEVRPSAEDHQAINVKYQAYQIRKGRSE